MTDYLKPSELDKLRERLYAALSRRECDKDARALLAMREGKGEREPDDAEKIPGIDPTANLPGSEEEHAAVVAEVL